MWIAKTIEQARYHRHGMNERVVVVPTMGALHSGHMQLIDQGSHEGGEVIVTIFVNPTQFGPGEDFERYPRTLDQDLEACRQAEVTGVFCPSVAEMYPPDQVAAELTVPDLDCQLEASIRPGHFAGVCRVVAKLFNILQPDVACFGQKDYQQLKVIEAMVDDLAMPVRIFAAPTVREDDGLAISSRNVYLSGEFRRRAVALYRSLCEAKNLVEKSGESDPGRVEEAMEQVLSAYQVAIDYAVIRHGQTLLALDSLAPKVTGPVVALVAGRIGGVRLIDSMLLG